MRINYVPGFVYLFPEVQYDYDLAYVDSTIGSR